MEVYQQQILTQRMSQSCLADDTWLYMSQAYNNIGISLKELYIAQYQHCNHTLSNQAHAHRLQQDLLVSYK